MAMEGVVGTICFYNRETRAMKAKPRKIVQATLLFLDDKGMAQFVIEENRHRYFNSTVTPAS